MNVKGKGEKKKETQNRSKSKIFKVRAVISCHLRPRDGLRRLQDMLQVLPAMMRPVVKALKAGDELVSQALRTLEHWVDSLNPEFLEPAMAAVAPELMLALWGHIKPSPATFGVKVRSPKGSCCLRPLVFPFHFFPPACVEVRHLLPGSTNCVLHFMVI